MTEPSEMSNANWQLRNTAEMIPVELMFALAQIVEGPPE